MKSPIRYAPRQFIGWKAYCSWSPIYPTAFGALELAQDACHRNAGHVLTWEVSVQTPEGHASYTGKTNQESRETWQASPDYEQGYEVIPGAEFVSEDSRCNIYIEPKGNAWVVNSQINLENTDPIEFIGTGLADDFIAARDMAKLWHFPEARADTKELALAYGRYVWGRKLVRQGLPPPFQSKIKAKLRNWARRLI